MIKKAVLSILILIVIALGIYLLFPFNEPQKKVVIYVAHDQDYSEPILKDFEESTGIQVDALYDTEATKTVGLVNRLIAEKNNPIADVFWNNEVMRTVMLKKDGLLEQYCSPQAADIARVYKDENCYWTGFAARARVIISNTDMMSDNPTSIYDLKDEEWKGKTCISNPLLGTTSTHAASIFALMGDEDAEKFFTDLKENDIQILESNSMVRDQVVAGECYFGLTDTDDAYDAVNEGKHVKMIFPDQGENDIGDLIIPNSVMIIKGAPHSEEAKILIDYLLSSQVEEKLAASALQMPLKESSNAPEGVPDVNDIKPLNLTQEQIYDKLDVSNTFVQDVFLK